MKEKVVIGCRPDPHDPQRQTRHRRWVWVKGVYATPEHHYLEQQCTRCKQYKSEVYG